MANINKPIVKIRVLSQNMNSVSLSMSLDKLMLKLGGTMGSNPDVILMQDLRLNLERGQGRWKTFKNSIKLD